MSKKIIVTGGAGFIGSRFISKLNSEGIEDVIVVDSLGCTEKWKNLVGLKITDVINPEKIFDSGVLKGAGGIIHMGAISATTELDVDKLFDQNFRCTKSLIEYSNANKIRMIYASSGATYGDGTLGFDDSEEMVPKLKPLNAYGFSKNLLDQWAIMTGAIKKVVGLRFFNVYGHNEYHKGEMSSVALKAYKWIKESGKAQLFKSYHPEYKDGEQKRDFIYVEDCCDVMWWFLNTPTKNGLYNLGTGKARSWNDLMNAVFAALKLPSKIEYVDMPENLKGHYQYFTEAKMDKFFSIGCPVKFRSLEDGVRDYVVNYLEKDSRVAK